MIKQKRIVFFGGGRWARILLSVFLKNTEQSIVYVIHTKHFVKEMQLWADKKGFGNRVFISGAKVDFQGVKYMAAVVANAAPEHKMVASKALAAKVPVLIEKPMTPSYTDTADLIAEATLNNTLLSGSWVFLYAPYIDNFIKHCGNIEDIQEVYFNWTDDVAELRYGEFKSFDVATPIFKDILPHVMSILSKILNSQVFEFIDCRVSRGGAYLNISISISNVKCYLTLERNASSRQRQISILGKKDIRLDFSNEPGTIYTDGVTLNGDALWGQSPSPLEKMVNIFLADVDSATKEQGFSGQLALSVSKLIDQIELGYLVSLDEWLKQHLNQNDINESDLHYFLSELVRGTIKVPYDESSKRIAQYLDVVCSTSLFRDFEKAKTEGLEDNLIKFISSLKIGLS